MEPNDPCLILATLNRSWVLGILYTFMKLLTQGTCIYSSADKVVYIQCLFLELLASTRLCAITHLYYSWQLTAFSPAENVSTPPDTRPWNYIHTGEGGVCHCIFGATVYCLYVVPPLKLCQRCWRLPFCDEGTSTSPGSRPKCPAP